MKWTFANCLAANLPLFQQEQKYQTQCFHLHTQFRPEFDVIRRRWETIRSVGSTSNGIKTKNRNASKIPKWMMTKMQASASTTIRKRCAQAYYVFRYTRARTSTKTTFEYWLAEKRNSRRIKKWKKKIKMFKVNEYEPHYHKRTLFLFFCFGIFLFCFLINIVPCPAFSAQHK